MRHKNKGYVKTADVVQEVSLKLEKIFSRNLWAWTTPGFEGCFQFLGDTPQAFLYKCDENLWRERQTNFFRSLQKRRYIMHWTRTCGKRLITQLDKEKKSEVSEVLMVDFQCIFHAEHDAVGRFSRSILIFEYWFSCNQMEQWFWFCCIPFNYMRISTRK